MPIKGPGGDVIVPMYDNPQVNEDIRSIIGSFSGRPLTDLFTVLPYFMAYVFAACNMPEAEVERTMKNLSAAVAKAFKRGKIIGKSNQVM